MSRIIHEKAVWPRFPVASSHDRARGLGQVVQIAHFPIRHQESREYPISHIQRPQVLRSRPERCCLRAPTRMVTPGAARLSIQTRLAPNHPASRMEIPEHQRVPSFKEILTGTRRSARKR